MKMNSNMSGFTRWFIIGVALILVTGGWGHPAPDPNNRGISDALKYLQELDRIYSHVAMPSLRSDRAFVMPNAMSSEMENAISMLKLHELDKLYSDRVRPRFGKRNELKHAIPDYDNVFQSEDNDKDWLSLSNGR